MQVPHRISSVSVVFDEDNLLADAGLVPVMALAEKVGLGALVDEHVRITDAKNAAGANAGGILATKSLLDLDHPAWAVPAPLVALMLG